MDFCLRVDLDYVPWDTPDAEQYGHGEPAMFMRLIELAKNRGYRFHFFASTRVLRAFPATAEAVLNEGHDLDWLCKHPTEIDRWEEAHTAFESIGHVPTGMSLKESWPENSELPVSTLAFVCSHLPAPTNLHHFEVLVPSLKHTVTSTSSYQKWLTNSLVVHKKQRLILPIVPQILYKLDPQLNHLSDILLKLPGPKTLRQFMPN